MNLTFRFVPLLTLGLLVGCGSESPPTPVPEAAIQAPAAPVVVDPAPVEQRQAEAAQDRARLAMKDFSERLRGQLRESMTRDGAPAAVDFCHDQAPLIADQVMAEHGLRLGRIAVPGRHRNPDHAADGWQAEALASFQSAVDRGAAPEAQVAVMQDALPAGVALRMARGIRVEAGCLMCHGASIAPEIAARIEQNYPGDHATGFREGDLRGLVWVEVPVAAAAAP
ncbi:Tll0287-like domain-containing protein [Arenimonas alkanexedens]